VSLACCTCTSHTDIRCQGTPGNPLSSQVSTTVTAIQSDRTATGTFALETVSSYTSLRQSITTSVSLTTTASGGTGIETAVAVIFAGGVSWILAGISLSNFGQAQVEKLTMLQELPGT